MLRRTFQKNLLVVDTPRSRQSFAIQLSRTQHGPNEASDRVGNRIAQCWNEPPGFSNPRNDAIAVLNDLRRKGRMGVQLKQEPDLQELAEIRLARAVLSVQLEVLAVRRSGPFSVASANPVDDKNDRSFAQRAVLAMRHIPDASELLESAGPRGRQTE